MNKKKAFAIALVLLLALTCIQVLHNAGLGRVQAIMLLALLIFAMGKVKRRIKNDSGG